MKNNFKIGIIGGKGKMGSSLKKFFQTKNIFVAVSDENSELSNIDIVKISDIVILAIPLTYYEKVLAEIEKYLNGTKILMDIGSLKLRQVNLMKKYFKGEILATHPLFGPEKNFMGKENNIVIHKINPGPKTEFILKLFSESRLNILEISPEKHDEVMAYIHGFYYLLNISYSKLLSDKFKEISLLNNYETTSFQTYLKNLDNIFNTGDLLIELIAYENPYIEKVKKDFFSLMNNRVNLKKIREFLYGNTSNE